MVDQVFDIEPRIQYSASAGQTVFPYPFPIFFETDVKVNVNGTLLTLTTDYTVDGVGNETGGNITLVAPSLAGDVVTIYRESVKQRLQDYQQNGDFLADDVNDDFDRLWLCLQENNAAFGRSIRVSIVDTATDLVLPVDREGQVITFDANGNVELQPITTVNGGPILTRTISATAGQTNFSVPSYIPGQNNIAVYQNGVRQIDADFIETDATTITLITPAFEGDTLYFVVNDFN